MYYDFRLDKTNSHIYTKIMKFGRIEEGMNINEHSYSWRT